MRVKTSAPLVMRVAEWASGHFKRCSVWQGFHRGLIIGTDPDGHRVRIAHTQGTTIVSALWVDLLPSQAMCGLVVKHAVDHLIAHARQASPGTQKQVPLESGELWKYAICTAIAGPAKGQQRGVIRNRLIRVSASTGGKASSGFPGGGFVPPQLRECTFGIIELDTHGFAYAEQRLARASMAFDAVPQFMSGLHAPPLPTLPPLTVDELHAADAAFEGV